MLRGPLTLAELDARRAEVLAGIAERGEVWEIRDGDTDFVLGPEARLGAVLGLYDDEYGWPTSVRADGPIESFVPAHRSHPFVVDGERVVAVAISPEEYAEIERRG